MKKALVFLILIVSTWAMAQVPPPPPTHMRVCDKAGDGVEEVNLNLIFYTISFLEEVEIYDYQMIFSTSPDYTTLIPDPVHYLATHFEVLHVLFIDPSSGDEYSELHFLIELTLNCVDSDSDGVPDVEEDLNQNQVYTDDDIDDDMIPNFLDPDDDGDSVLTAYEDYNINGNLHDDDVNNNVAPDYLDFSASLSTLEVTKNNFSLYPNPASSIVNLRFTNAINEKIDISIYTMEGKQVLRNIKEVSGTETKVDVSSLSSGVYFIKVNENNSNIVKKLILK